MKRGKEVRVGGRKIKKKTEETKEEKETGNHNVVQKLFGNMNENTPEEITRRDENNKAEMSALILALHPLAPLPSCLPSLSPVTTKDLRCLT